MFKKEGEHCREQQCLTNHGPPLLRSQASQSFIIFSWIIIESDEDIVVCPALKIRQNCDISITRQVVSVPTTENTVHPVKELHGCKRDWRQGGTNPCEKVEYLEVSPQRQDLDSSGGLVALLQLQM